MPEVRWNDGRSRRHLFGLLQTEGHEGDRHESSMKATQATFWQDLKTLVNAKTTSTDDGVWLTHWSSVRNRNLPFFSLHHLNNGDQWKIQRCTKGVNQFEFWPSLLRVWHWELGDEVLPLHEFGLLQLDELSWPRVELLKSEPVEDTTLTTLNCLTTHFWFTNTYVHLFSSIGQECMSQLFNLAKAAPLRSDPTDQVRKSEVFSALIIDDHPGE